MVAILAAVVPYNLSKKTLTTNSFLPSACHCCTSCHGITDPMPDIKGQVQQADAQNGNEHAGVEDLSRIADLGTQVANIVISQITVDRFDASLSECK